MIYRLLLINILICTCALAEEQHPTVESSHNVETSHTVRIAGKTIPYKATTGTVTLKDENDKPKANLFYVSYVAQEIPEAVNRPILFCFNGGPGCPSVWLHVGVLGPKRIIMDGEKRLAPPYTFVDNPYSLLDVADLVFIDPVGTGYSRAATGEDPKQYFGVDEDIKSISEFIRIYATANKRWNSPKFLVGESYGTTRAVGLASYMHNDLKMYLNGIVLISSVFNFQTIIDNDEGGNDLPYILSFPTYALTAGYHQKLPAEYKNNVQQAVQEAERFALNEYTRALMYGDLLPEQDKQAVIATYAKLTGLSPEFIDKHDLRVSSAAFRQELLEKEGLVLGRFDSRLKGISPNKCQMSEERACDPSFDAYLGPFTSIINDYLTKELKVEKEQPYVMLANVNPWKWGNSENQFFNLSQTIKETLCRNPQLKVFVASGRYDLATPYFATQHTFNHLGIDPSLKKNIVLKEYDGGHMMYMEQKILEQLRADILDFMKSAQ